MSTYFLEKITCFHAGQSDGGITLRFLTFSTQTPFARFSQASVLGSPLHLHCGRTGWKHCPTWNAVHPAVDDFKAAVSRIGTALNWIGTTMKTLGHALGLLAGAVFQNHAALENSRTAAKSSPATLEFPQRTFPSPGHAMEFHDGSRRKSRNRNLESFPGTPRERSRVSARNGLRIAHRALDHALSRQTARSVTERREVTPP